MFNCNIVTLKKKPVRLKSIYMQYTQLVCNSQNFTRLCVKCVSWQIFWRHCLIFPLGFLKLMYLFLYKVYDFNKAICHLSYPNAFNLHLVAHPQ